MQSHHKNDSSNRRSGNPDRVILLHGLSRTSGSMRRIKRALEGEGFQVTAWDYPSRKYSVEELAQQFRDWLSAQNLDGARVHFVSHSLGGILLRMVLQAENGFRSGRIVMIAPPNQGAGVVRHYARFPLLQQLYGKPASQMSAGAHWLQKLPSPPVELGVIAGNRRFHPLNPTAYLTYLSARDVEHDGTVEVENTRLAGMRDFVLVPANHTFICSHPQTIHQTLHFLARGCFDHPTENAASTA